MRRCESLHYKKINLASPKYTYYRITLVKPLAVVEAKLYQNASMVLTVPQGSLAMYGRNHFKRNGLSSDILFRSVSVALPLVAKVACHVSQNPIVVNGIFVIPR